VSLGVNESTTRRYLDLLTDLFMVRQLQPWHANLRKRQVKSPKVYLRNSGLLHQLLGAIAPDDAYFWATHQGAEIDLVLRVKGHLVGVECKRTDAPRMTPSMRIAVVYLGSQRYRISQEVEAVPFAEIHSVFQ